MDICLLKTFKSPKISHLKTYDISFGNTYSYVVMFIDKGELMQKLKGKTERENCYGIAKLQVISLGEKYSKSWYKPGWGAWDCFWGR